jgi:hypothetical protein
VSPEQKRIVLRLNGKESKKPDLWLSGLGRNAGLFGMVSESKAFDLAPTAQRGVIDAPIDTEIPDDALVEVEFDNGARFWTTGMDLRDRLTPPAQRTSRALVDDGTPWTLPASLDIPGERRGLIGKLTLKALRWVGFDPVKAGRDLAIKYAQTRTVPTEGLFRVGDDGIAGAPLTESIPDGGPVLILLHGTASCTRGSFSKFWLRQGEHWSTLRKRFGDRIYALEHWTLTRSPIDNALAVARLLPAKASVSFISHSRGGLIGELLCLDPQAIDCDGAIARLNAQQAESADDKAAVALQVANFKALMDELGKRTELRIERFARVACPVLGTSLAGDKLDKWGSLLVLAAIADEMRLSGKRGFDIDELARPLVKLGLDTLGETVAGILASRKKASELPGLLAMMPGSAVVSLINASPGRGELYAVAGDAEPAEGDWLADIRFWLTDRFYERDHDLVVDTRAMLDGPQRAARPDGSRGKVMFRSGSDVNHFSYFGNPDSARAVAAALTFAPEADSLFRNYYGTWPLGDPAADGTRGLFGPRPIDDPALKEAHGIVVIVPGLCGSELKQGARELWASLLALAGGAFTEDLDINNRNINPGGPLVDSYLALANALRQRGYRVVMHGYDWRKPIADSVAGLDSVLSDALAEAKTIGKPVHAIVHSMGGVLIRRTFANDPTLWSTWSAQPGDPRVIMLGTPNKGSHAVTLLLTGRDKFFRQLAFLDLRHSQAELLKTAIQFQGVLELLPVDPNENGNEIRQAQTWTSYKAGDAAADWPTPPADVLAQSRTVWDDLAVHDPLIGDERLIYVAGMAPQTPVKAHVIDGRFELLSTPAGDGRVPWASGIPPVCTDNGRVYYVDAVHGDLPKTREAFDGYIDLIERGTTDKLSASPRLPRGASTEALMPYDSGDTDAALYPTRGDLLAAATGGSATPPSRRTSKETWQARVRVRHGDLLFADSPLLVGHMWGANTLEYAEKLLDQALGGRLQKRVDAGLHPGALGTYAYFRKHSGEPFTHGAIVIGMGRIGQLSSGQLTLSVARAVAAYAIEELEWQQSNGAASQNGPISLPVSALLIGAGVGELTLQDSVAAILRGHRDARMRLRDAGLESLVRLDALDFIEILEDRAIQALRAARDAVEFDATLRPAYFVDDSLKAHKGARRRAYAAAEEGLWQRIAISTVDTDEGRDPKLLFDAYGDLARAERMVNAVPLKDIERFTHSLIATEQDQEQVGRALFELLVPNWLKDQAPDRRRAQLVLDKTAASFPWELLRDRGSVHDGDGGQPLSVRSGLIRQLSTGSFRQNVRRPTGFNALVVGDPDSGEWSRYLPRLNGARTEAQRVAMLLGEAGYGGPAPLIGTDARTILLELYREDWRILHLSGHGVYLEEIPETAGIPARRQATGMVIGGGDLLTPAHIEQMRIVPDLVFLNCCTLGRIESDAQLPEGARPGNPQLAANLATQLIEIGVRGVIAAGWKVLDKGALVFADTFYKQFLAGESFGDAVLAARRETFERYPASNTWGAYQCYGDPGFVLQRSSTGTASKSGPTVYRFVSASEALCELERLALHASSYRKIDEAIVDSLDNHAKPLLVLCEQRGWIAQGNILEGFARVMGEYADHDAAIAFYRRALAAPDGSASRKAEEQLANMLTRSAQRKAVGADKASGEAAMALLDEAETVLGLGPAQRFANPERFSLLGAIGKRRLACALQCGTDWSPGELLKTLGTIQTSYAEAERLAVDTGEPRYYPGLNADQAAALRLLAGDLDEAARTATEASLAAIQAELGPDFRLTDFWSRAAPSDLALTRWLLDVASGREGEVTAATVAESYKAVMNSHASGRERESVVSTLNVLWLATTRIAGLPGIKEKGATKKAKAGIAAILKAIAL